MSNSVNKVILIGYLGSDPKMSCFQDGNSCANFSLATNQNFKDKKTSEQRQQTEWHNICLFYKLAEVARDYMKKGNRIYLEGTLRTRKYTDKDNIERRITEIVGRYIQLLDKKEETEADVVADDNNDVPF